MTAFVLDASVAISWCFPADPTENTPYSSHILSLLGMCDAVVPEIWAFEIANALFVSFTKRKRIAESQIQEYIRTLRALPIRLESRDLWSNVELESLARQWVLTPYDAAYLDLAKRLGLPLATSDEELRHAAVMARIEIVSLPPVRA